MKKWWYKIRAHWALEKIESLERKRMFINDFFLGETAYPIRLKEWEVKMEKAKKEYEKYKKYL